MADVAVREATARDAEAIAGIHVRAWQSAYAHLLAADFLAGIDLDVRVERWTTMLEHPAPGLRTLAAVESGVVLGFASWGPGRGKAKPYEHELFSIYLEPERVGTGVGKALMDSVLDEMHQLGLPGAFLWVFGDNPRTRRFYETAGWYADGAEQAGDFGGVSPIQVRYRIDFS